MQQSLKFLLAVTAFFVLAESSARTRTRSFDHSDITHESVVFDLHNDALHKMDKLGEISVFGGSRLQVTLPRIKKSGVNALFFAAWVRHGEGFARAVRLINIFYKMLDAYSDELAFAGSYLELEHNRAEGRISALLGVEGGAAIGDDLGKIDYFYRRGVRYMTLTWNYNNKIADSSTDNKSLNHGLSSFGRKVVQRMNLVGMIVDVSHASDETVEDVLAASRAPVIASHSCCYSLRHHPRNLKDHLIKGICDKGGVIGINFYSKFLASGGDASVKDVANHIEHVVKVGGIGCAALGSDYDGIPTPAKGLENIGKLENLTRELIGRGYTREEIEKIYGLNMVRVLKSVVDDNSAGK